MKGQTEEREQWVNEVMDSIQGMQRIAADPLMYDKVMNRINNPAGRRNVRVLFTRVAAAAALLLLVNIASVLHATHAAKATQGIQQKGVYDEVSESMDILSEDSF